MEIKIISYKENVKPDSHLLGYFTVYLPQEEIFIARMRDFQRGDQTWVEMVAYSQQDPHDPTKWQFYSIVTFARAKQNEFLEECRKSLKEFKQRTNPKDKE